MKAGKFIEDYLSQCEDTVVFLHSPHSNSGTMFSIYEWHHEVIDEPNLIYDVSQITARVENFKGGLNVVIHIYTECPYEKAKLTRRRIKHEHNHKTVYGHFNG